MMFLNVYIAFSILTYVLVLMQSYVIEKRLIRKYPDVANKLKEDNKSGIVEDVFTYITIFIKCSVPIMNILIFCGLLLASERVEEKVFDKVMKKAAEEIFNETLD